MRSKQAPSEWASRRSGYLLQACVRKSGEPQGLFVCITCGRGRSRAVKQESQKYSPFLFAVAWRVSEREMTQLCEGSLPTCFLLGNWGSPRSGTCICIIVEPNMAPNQTRPFGGFFFLFSPLASTDQPEDATSVRASTCQPVKFSAEVCARQDLPNGHWAAGNKAALTALHAAYYGSRLV